MSASACHSKHPTEESRVGMTTLACCGRDGVGGIGQGGEVIRDTWRHMVSDLVRYGQYSNACLVRTQCFQPWINYVFFWEIKIILSDSSDSGPVYLCQGPYLGSEIR